MIAIYECKFSVNGAKYEITSTIKGNSIIKSINAIGTILINLYVLSQCLL